MIQVIQYKQSILLYLPTLFCRFITNAYYYRYFILCRSIVVTLEYFMFVTLLMVAQTEEGHGGMIHCADPLSFSRATWMKRNSAM